MNVSVLSAGVALGFAVLAFSPAEAATLSPKSVIAAPSFVDDVACRTVTKRVRRPNGTVRVTTSRVCDSARRPLVRERRVYRPAPRPGISIRVNP